MESKSVSEDLLICKSLPSSYIFKGFHVQLDRRKKIKGGLPMELPM